jgi:hypothetical protein
MEHYKVAIESEKWFFDFVQRFDVLVQKKDYNLIGENLVSSIKMEYHIQVTIGF